MKAAWRCAFAVLAGLSLFMAGCKKDEATPESSSPTASTGTSGSEAPKTAPELKSGFKLYDLADFSIQLPEGWKSYDLTSDQFEAMMKESFKDPGQEALKQQVMAAKTGGQIKIMAFDEANTKDGFTSNMNAIVLPVPAGIDLTKLVEANLEQLKTSGLAKGDPQVSDVKAANGDAKLLKWTMSQSGKDMDLYTFLAVANGKQYTFTFTALPGSDAFFKQADEAAGTIMFK